MGLLASGARSSRDEAIESTSLREFASRCELSDAFSLTIPRSTTSSFQSSQVNDGESGDNGSPSHFSIYLLFAISSQPSPCTLLRNRGVSHGLGNTSTPWRCVALCVFIKVKCKVQTALAHIQVCIPDSKMPMFYRRSRITSRDVRIQVGRIRNFDLAGRAWSPLLTSPLTFALRRLECE